MSSHENLPIDTECPFESRFLEVNGHQLHYIDQGSGSPILFLHGNPTWLYMWRNIIPYLQNSARCIAVDLIGMGRSDKPDIGYTFLEHVDYVSQFIEKLGLTNVVLVGHDWGMAIGLQVANNHPDQVKAIAMIEPQALYPCPSWEEFTPVEATELFQTLRDPELGWPLMRDKSVFVEGMPTIIINRTLTADEHEHYREPFKDHDSRKPMWVFPNQIPIAGEPSEVVQAVRLRNTWFTESTIPKILFYAAPGCTIREPQISWCQANLKYLTTFDIGKGYHHLVEENPHDIGQELQRWYLQVSQG